MKVIEINSIEGWELLSKNENSLLVDVRTSPEFKLNGTVDLSEINKDTLLISWKNYPQMQIDPQFSEKLNNILQEKFSELDNDKVHLLFICSGGVRSFEAAELMSNLNYQCYNIYDGFEGNINHDGRKNGWKANNLPWRQN